MTRQRLIRPREKGKRRIAGRQARADSARSLHGATHSSVLQLQRTLGNQHVAQLMRAKRLTPQGKIIGLQRRACAAATSGEGECQTLQSKSTAGLVASGSQPQAGKDYEQGKSILADRVGPQADSFEAESAIESRLSMSKGHGSRLPDAVRAYMEPRFGADFSQVRVHTDASAVQMNRGVGAEAFTHGSDIYFGAGNGPNDLALTTHELTHVVQQAGGIPLQTKRVDETASSDGSGLAIQRTCAACGARMKEQEGGVDGESSTQSIQRRIGDGHDLTSPRFAGDPVLEACFDNERLLRFGARGDAVKKLQQALVDAGFPLLKFGVDEIFGSETQTAVRNFQRAATIAVDGLVGPETMGALDARFSGPTPPGPTPPGPTPPGPTPPGPTPPGPTPPGPTPPGPTPPGPTPPAPAPESITSQTVATSPGAQTRTTIGVGEQVNLTHAPGSAAWTTTIGPTPLSATNGITVILTAPDTAQRITVTAGTATLAFDVIAPTSVAMDRQPGTGVQHKVNRPRSGIQTRVFLGPDTVNFSRARYRELDVAGTASSPGVYSCNPASGGHCGAGGGGAPCPDKALTNTVVAGMGTQSLLGDCACSGDCNTPPPFVAGSLTLSIPYEYKVGAGAFHAITNVPQVHTLAADLSTLTSSKAGATGTTTVAAGTVALPQCPGCPVS